MQSRKKKGKIKTLPYSAFDIGFRPSDLGRITCWQLPVRSASICSMSREASAAVKAFAVARSSEVGIGLGSVATAVAIAAGSSVCDYGMLVGSSWGAK